MQETLQTDGWHDFLELCLRAKTHTELDELLQLLLTIDERKELVGRYRIVKELLSAQYSQREIAQRLGVSISKITRGSNSLKLISDELKQFLSRIVADSSKKDSVT